MCVSLRRLTTFKPAAPVCTRVLSSFASCEHAAALAVAIRGSSVLSRQSACYADACTQREVSHTITSHALTAIIMHIGVLLSIPSSSCDVSPACACMQTETGMIMITPLPGAWPLKPGCASLPFFGVHPVFVDEHGKELDAHGKVEGRLCLKQAWPGMMRTLLGDHKRFEETYFSPMQVNGMLNGNLRA